MNRREILKYTAMVTGAAISAPLASSLLLGCQRDESADSSGTGDGLAFFSESEMARVQKMVDTILPKTDSPAASEVGVHTMIDHMVGTVYPEADRQAYRASFDQLNQYLSDNAFDKAADGEESLALLLALDPAQSADLAKAAAAFLTFKQQTIAYYMNTEEIATNFLNYLPVPGEFEACIPVSQVGNKAWAE